TNFCAAKKRRRSSPTLRTTPCAFATLGSSRRSGFFVRAAHAFCVGVSAHTGFLLAHCGGGQGKPGCLGPSRERPGSFLFRPACPSEQATCPLSCVTMSPPSVGSPVFPCLLKRKQRPERASTWLLTLIPSPQRSRTISTSHEPGSFWMTSKL